MAVNYRKTLISCYLGFITQAIAANFAPLLFLTFHNGYGIPLGKIALISSVFFVTQLIIDVLCARFADKIGYRKCVIGSQAFSALGLIGQGFKDMSPPTKELMKLVLEQKIAHGGQPVLRWNMDNIYIRTDPAGNIKADKEKSTEKIDGAVATIMALDRTIRCGNDHRASVYDERGILFI